MQNINLKKYLNQKTFLYTIILIFAYYLGDSDLENYVYKKFDLNPSVNTSDLRDQEYIVNKVIDGDTVHVVDSSGKETILRFLAVDTLEKNSQNPREKCLADLQTEFTTENLLNQKVFLEIDETQGEKDKYGRTLVYLKITPSGLRLDSLEGVNVSSQTDYITFNELLLATGNAKVFYASPPAKYIKKYLEIEKEAKQKKLGMWNPELCR